MLEVAELVVRLLDLALLVVKVFMEWLWLVVVTLVITEYLVTVVHQVAQHNLLAETQDLFLL
jgi:hypothetical protein